MIQPIAATARGEVTRAPPINPIQPTPIRSHLIDDVVPAITLATAIDGEPLDTAVTVETKVPQQVIRRTATRPIARIAQRRPVGPIQVKEDAT